MKNRPFITGIIAAVSPIPLLIFTTLWLWFLGFGIALGLLNYPTIPDWALVCGLLPLLISPALGLTGMIHSIVKIKTKTGWLGILLSLIGLAENFILIFGMGYLGSRF